MAGKKPQTPAPIDRPLSRAYLRKFTGWSTAHPPGMSDPTSLRQMENVQVCRDGSVGVRPGLRYLSYATVPTDLAAGVALSEQLVGTHEAFFLNDGAKAYLFAVREVDETVGFRVLRFGEDTAVVHHLTDAGIDFSIPQGEAQLNFSADTTYVKYLQIDNKIFALSNAGETMRLFFVGDNKIARRLSAIERPDWSVADKLTVVHPDATWINAAVPLAVRTNLVPNPSFEATSGYWTPGSLTSLETEAGAGSLAAVAGSQVAKLTSLPSRTNLQPQPLHNIATYGVTGWAASTWSVSTVAAAGWMKTTADDGYVGRKFYAVANNRFTVRAGTAYRISFDFNSYAHMSQISAVLRFYNSAGAQVGSDAGGSWSPAASRFTTGGVTAPSGAVTGRVLFYGTASHSTLPCWFEVRNVVVCKYGEATTMFSGSTGANYFWTGTVNDSSSVYHPPASLSLTSSKMAVTAALAYVASLHLQAGAVGGSGDLKINWYNSASALLSTSTVAVTDIVGSWGRKDLPATAPADATQAEVALAYTSVPRDEYHYVDAVMLEQAAVVDTYFDGDTPDVSPLDHAWSGSANASASTETEYSASGTTLPTAETATVDTLISSTAADNLYNFGFFYTFSNEIGESAASQVTVVRAQRPWSGWRWETPDAAGAPSGTKTEDPTLCADQLAASIPASVYAEAIAQGATEWRLYMLTWSDQDPIPVEGIQVGVKTLSSTTPHGTGGWLHATPEFPSAAATAVRPTSDTRRNYSDPSRGGQGLVASDRMVLVFDPTDAAVIRWTSNQQGSYTDFTAAKGGGYKTLTSGNLLVPATVKLWQNPQSVDTLTILCLGTDSRSVGYYMAPAQVAQQSEATNIMGFEETSATPGTVSPYGCEVANNALYHPLDEQLMKSTATNYNINHASMTELIRNRWSALLDKQRMVSSFHDNRIYYLVHNPLGELLEQGCNGNEIWVLDISKEASGAWSRFLIQAHSLRKIEQGGRPYMSVVRPDGVYYLDPLYDRDDVVDPDTLEVSSEFISWSLETNTQGANRAHDAWCHLQQANLVVGNFLGTMRYGIRGHDVNGKPVEISKLLRDAGTDTLGEETWDLEDYLPIQRQLKEWFFFAESATDDLGAVERSTGQLCLVQYRYTPISVNVGYEWGSVETFEYGRAGNTESDRTTVNGVPMPYLDTGRP